MLHEGTCNRRRGAAGVLSVTLALLFLAGTATGQDGSWEMSVCADPASMPFSNREEEGFENRIAEILADELGADLTYVWWPQGPTMISNQLREGNCDIIMGIPDGHAELLSTIAYYRSPYVFVYRSDSGFEIESLDDPVLGELRIGVQRTGIAPHEALLKRGLGGNVTLQYGDRGYGDNPDPLAFLVEAVAEDIVDVGLVWGPVAGYYASRSEVPLTVDPVTPEIDPPFLSMSTSMTVGVRPGDEALRDLLSDAIASRWDDIQQVLADYGVPLQELPPPFPTQAREGGASTARIGLVIPTQTGTVPVMASLFDIVGEAARAGALLAEDDVDVATPPDGIQVELLLASSPSAEAAGRAVERLLANQEVTALIGGIGRGQAEVISELAESHGVPLMNIGSTSIPLREACRRFTFHVEASAAMYVDALVEWHSAAGGSRWFIVAEDGDEGAATLRAAEASVERSGGEVVGTATVVPGQPHYLEELNGAREADADVILFLGRAEDQIPFLAQHASAGPEVPLAVFPDPVTQTRDFLAAAQYQSRNPLQTHRVHLWETTLQEGGAADLNERFISRWGRPMDPSAWAAYAAVVAVHQALNAVGGSDGATLVEYFESPEAAFDVQKGPAVSFRPGTHQLRQPLYAVQLVPDAQWGANVSQRVAVAELAGTLPAATDGEGADARSRLDALGTAEEGGADCSQP